MAVDLKRYSIASLPSDDFSTGHFHHRRSSLAALSYLNHASDKSNEAFATFIKKKQDLHGTLVWTTCTDVLADYFLFAALRFRHGNYSKSSPRLTHEAFVRLGSVAFEHVLGNSTEPLTDNLVASFAQALGLSKKVEPSSIEAHSFGLLLRPDSRGFVFQDGMLLEHLAAVHLAGLLVTRFDKTLLDALRRKPLSKRLEHFEFFSEDILSSCQEWHRTVNAAVVSNKQSAKNVLKLVLGQLGRQSSCYHFDALLQRLFAAVHSAIIASVHRPTSVSSYASFAPTPPSRLTRNDSKVSSAQRPPLRVDARQLQPIFRPEPVRQQSPWAWNSIKDIQMGRDAEPLYKDTLLQDLQFFELELAYESRSRSVLEHCFADAFSSDCFVATKRFPDDQLSHIGSCLGTMLRLHRDFYGLQLTNLGGAQITRLLTAIVDQVGDYEEFAIQLLDLSGNELTESDFVRLLVQLLKKTLRLSFLYLVNCGIGDSGVAKLCDTFMFTPLIELNLSGNGISDIVMARLLRDLRVCFSLESLNLSDNNITLAGCFELAQFLLESRLVNLNISKNKGITALGAQRLLQSAQVSPLASYLNLAETGLPLAKLFGLNKRRISSASPAFGNAVAEESELVRSLLTWLPKRVKNLKGSFFEAANPMASIIIILSGNPEADDASVVQLSKRLEKANGKKSK